MRDRYETIKVRIVDDGIVHLCLNRPECLNAINKVMLDELNDVLDEIERDQKCRVLVVSGEGRAFCAGFDLKEDVNSQKRINNVKSWRPLLEYDFDTILRFWNLRCPTIGAVQGHCVGGGCEIALSCDLTIASADAQFGEPEVKFGSGIVAMMLPWVVGIKKAKEIILLGRTRILADEALRIGMINEVVPNSEALPRALDLAHDMANVHPHVMQLTKRALNQSLEAAGMTTALRMALELDIQIEGLDTPDAIEFRSLVYDKNLKAALRWRDSRFKAV